MVMWQSPCHLWSPLTRLPLLLSEVSLVNPSSTTNNEQEYERHLATEKQMVWSYGFWLSE